MLEKHEMSKCNTAPLPFENGLLRQILRQGRAAPDDPKADPNVDSTEYRSILGGLNFPAVMTRPDLSNTVSVLQRYQQTPRTSHFNAARRVQRYVQGTHNLGLRYTGGAIQLSAFRRPTKAEKLRSPSINLVDSINNRSQSIRGCC